MRKILRLLISIYTLTAPVYQARAEEGNYGWMDSTLSNILNFISGCIEVPRIANMVYSSKALNLTQPEKWVSTGLYVQEGRLLQIEWDLRGVEPRPEKYLVLYRIDPRFRNPQVYIQKYNYADGKYISDFYQFNNGKFLEYQQIPEMAFQARIQNYLNYFNFVSRPKIPVKVNDVINITLDGSGKYFASNAEMNNELTGPLSEPAILYTSSSGMDNKIIYTDFTPWCTAISNSGCSRYGYINTHNIWDGLVGTPADSSFNLIKSSIPSCPDGSRTSDNRNLCEYDKGRGMKLQIGSKTIKDTYESFISSPFTGKDFFYYKSGVSGDLNFVTDWQIDGMFSGGISQFMDSWLGFGDYYNFKLYLNALAPGTLMNFLHFGRYEMEIEIGNAEATVTPDQLKDIKVEYVIMESGTPDNAVSGNNADMEYKTNANDSGYLWLRVINPNQDNGGSINVKLANYTGSTWFSDIVYGKLVKPLREKFNELTKQVYSKLVSNSILQNIAKSMLTLYVMIYGLAYLAGAVQISVMDLVTRILKVIIILILFSNKSWNFFNDNVFTIFIDGTDYLLTSVVGVTSRVGNVFGFVDPVFDKYTNGTIWGLLFIQLLMIHNGMCFFAVITIYSILLYFRSLLEVIVSYCLAFLGLAIMVSLAPIFITFLLFEQTKNMFYSWISTMFSYMMQPTILLIFFLLIDQLMGEHITKTVARACWDILIPIEIGLDLHFMGIPLSFSFTLPFLPGIPFYVGQIQEINSIDDLLGRNDGTFLVIATSSLLFYAYSKLAYGLVDYVTIVVQNLTNVVAARQSGRLQAAGNPAQDIVGDIKSAASPVTDRLEAIANFAKRKLIDQKIDHTNRSKQSESINDFAPGVRANTKTSSSSTHTHTDIKPASNIISQGSYKPAWKTAKPRSGSSADAKPSTPKGLSLGASGAGVRAPVTKAFAWHKSSETKPEIDALPKQDGTAKPKPPKPLPKTPGLKEKIANEAKPEIDALPKQDGTAKPKPPKPLPKTPRLEERLAKLRAKAAEANPPKDDVTGDNRDSGRDIKEGAYQDNKTSFADNAFSEEQANKNYIPSHQRPQNGDNKIADQNIDSNDSSEIGLKEIQKDSIKTEKTDQAAASDKPTREKGAAELEKKLSEPTSISTSSGGAGSTEKSISRSNPTTNPVNKSVNNDE